MRHIFPLAALFLFSIITFAETNAPSPADALWNKACSAIDSRRYSNAEKLFDDFIKRNFNDERVASARIYIGICDYNQNRSQRALDAWDRVMKAEIMQKRSSPALLLGLEQLAIHYRAQQNMSEQEKILSSLLQMFPDDPLTIREHTLSARACIESGDYMKAAGLYEKVSDSLKGRDMEDYRLAKELAAPGGSVAAIITSANKQLADNSLNTAARLYEEVLKRNPSSDERYEAMTKLGWCLYLRHNYKEAESLWEQVIKQGDKGNEWVGRSRWHMIQLLTGPLNKTDKAIELCNAQAVEFPGSFRGQQGMFIKAWIYWLEKDWRNAHQAFTELISDYPHMAHHAPIQGYIRECEEHISGAVNR